MRYYESLNYKSEEVYNKVYIIKMVNNRYRDKLHEFSFDTWFKLKQLHKASIIKETIRLHQCDNVIIGLPAEYYIRELDAVMFNLFINDNKNREIMKTISISVSFHTIAAMEGDWDNGENKLLHAINWMGPDTTKELKRLFPAKYNKLLAN